MSYDRLEGEEDRGLRRLERMVLKPFEVGATVALGVTGMLLRPYLVKSFGKQLNEYDRRR